MQMLCKVLGELQNRIPKQISTSAYEILLQQDKQIEKTNFGFC
jgi:hypothetical protein